LKALFNRLSKLKDHFPKLFTDMQKLESYLTKLFDHLYKLSDDLQKLKKSLMIVDGCYFKLEFLS